MFKLAIFDYSFTLNHAALEVFNLETMLDYSKRVFKFSKDGNDTSNKMWLVSCASHTMHRFVRGLKKDVKFQNSKVREFSIFCFALLLNSRDLDTASKIFTYICRVFLSPTNTKDCVSAKTMLDEILSARAENQCESSVSKNNNNNKSFKENVIRYTLDNVDDNENETDDDDDNDDHTKDLKI